jgi:hypothetical protein
MLIDFRSSLQSLRLRVALRRLTKIDYKETKLPAPPINKNYSRKLLRSVHKIRTNLGGRGRVSDLLRSSVKIGICTVLRYEGGGRSKISKNCVRILCTLPYCPFSIRSNKKNSSTTQQTISKNQNSLSIKY